MTADDPVRPVPSAPFDPSANNGGPPGPGQEPHSQAGRGAYTFSAVEDPERGQGASEGGTAQNGHATRDTDGAPEENGGHGWYGVSGPNGVPVPGNKERFKFSSEDPPSGWRRTAGLGLRLAEFVFLLISFSVTASATSATSSFSGVAFCLSMAVIGCAYSLAVLLLELLSSRRRTSFPFRRLQFFADFVFMLLIFASASTSATYVSLTCTSWDYISYNCSLVGAGSALAFLGAFCLLAQFWMPLLALLSDF